MSDEKKRAYRKQYYQKHKEKENPYTRAYYQEHKEELRAHRRAYAHHRKLEILSHYSTNGIPQCARCDITDIDILTIDHINGGGSQHRRKVGWGNNFYLWLQKQSYPEGYQVLCANCNLKKQLSGRK